MKRLLASDKALTIQLLARELNVSNSTIRNDLIEIEHLLILNGLILVKNQGIGVWISGSDDLKQEMLKKINEIQRNDKVELHSKEYRIRFILVKLLLDVEEYINAEEIAEELYVSRSTIQKDFQVVEKWLEKFDLRIELKRKSGFKIDGTEINCRRALAELILITTNENKINVIEEDKNTRLDGEIVRQIKEIVGLEYKHLEKIIADAEKKLDLNFSDESYGSLAIHIAIAIKRIQDGNEINNNNLPINNLKSNKEYLVAKSMVKDIEKYYKVIFKEAEIQYLYLHIAGTKYMENPLEDLEVDLNLQDELCQSIANEIIDVVEKVYNEDFHSDIQFYNGLMIHLRPTMNRLEYGMMLKNPLLSQIKQMYPKAYGVAWMTNDIFEKYLGKTITDEEIGYITIHIEAALERKSGLIKTIIVCSTGMGTAQLLATKIQKRFRQIDLVNVESYASFLSKDNANVDLILSTIPIKTNIPSLLVSPLLTTENIKKILNFIESKSINLKIDYKVRDLLKEVMVIENLRFKTKNEVLKYAADYLVNKNLVKENYYNCVLKRELKYSTEIGKGVAIPHAALDTVKKTNILIIILDEPISWDTTKVDIVVFISVNENDANWVTKTLKSVYSCFDNDDLLHEIRSINSKRDIKNLLYKEVLSK